MAKWNFGVTVIPPTHSGEPPTREVVDRVRRSRSLAGWQFLSEANQADGGSVLRFRRRESLEQASAASG